MICEAVFYQLGDAAAEDVLPRLLDRAAQAGWRVELRGPDRARMESLDLALWAEGFRPHGLAGGPHDDLQPVLLTTGPAGGCDCLVALDGAEVEPAEAGVLKRILVVFGPEDLATARAQWRALTAAGLPSRYFEWTDGAWALRHESPART